MTESIMDRMKRYERAWSLSITPRMPVIIRVDGRSFHSYTKGCKRPFDPGIINAMWEVARALCSDIQGAQLAYVQSDEISVLVHNYKTIHSGSWFDNKVQKMASISAAIASSKMTEQSFLVFGKMKPAQFDSRVFSIPEADVCNYFLARQQDWQRNSVQMLARSLYSHKQCKDKNNSEMQEMCFQKGKNWNDLPVHLRRGASIIRKVTETLCKHCDGTGLEPSTDKICSHCNSPNGAIYRSTWEVDKEIPIFTRDRSYIEQHLAVVEE